MTRPRGRDVGRDGPGFRRARLRHSSTTGCSSSRSRRGTPRAARTRGACASPTAPRRGCSVSTCGWRPTSSVRRRTPTRATAR